MLAPMMDSALRRYSWAVLIVSELCACGKHDAPAAAKTAPAAAASAAPVPPTLPTSAAPSAASGGELMSFMPEHVAGLARTDVIHAAGYSISRYKLPDNSFAVVAVRHSDAAFEANYAKSYGSKSEQVEGFTAYAIPIEDEYLLHWHLPNDITVEVSAHNEKLARQIASELGIAKLASARP